MNNNPIGVFDSGVGGLTVLKYLQKSLPNENFIYVGDTKRVPYGDRSREEIIKFSLEIVEFLLSKNVKSIIIACNTIDSIAYEEIKKVASVPVLGIINSGVELALETTNNRKIGLLATNGTINTGAYESKIKSRGNYSLISKGMPDFVKMVEAGSREKLDEILENDLKDIKDSDIDTLILGCTHFPVLSREIGSYFGDSVKLVDPAKKLSENLSKDYTDEICQNDLGGNTEYYATGDIEKFQEVAFNILNKKLDNVCKLSL